MENRNGLVVGADATLATGTAERDAAATFSERLPKGATLGADKDYDAEAFVEGLKARGIEPHVAINGTVSKHGKARKTAVPSDVAASRPPGFRPGGSDCASACPGSGHMRRGSFVGSADSEVLGWGFSCKGGGGLWWL